MLRADWGRADWVLRRCDIFWACGKAPYMPVGGISAVSPLNEKLQVDLLLLDYTIVFRAMATFPRYAPSVPARPKRPSEVRDAVSGSRAGVFGRPRSPRMDRGD